jgi:hypothetical protein
MNRSDFLKLSALIFGGIVVHNNPYKLGVEKTLPPLIKGEPRIVHLKRFYYVYHVMTGDEFHLAHDEKEVLTLPITKNGTITFFAIIRHPDLSLEYVVGDDELYNKMKPFYDRPGASES